MILKTLGVRRVANHRIPFALKFLKSRKPLSI